LPLTSESVGIEATEFVVDFQTERLGTLADVTPAQGSEECQILDNRSEAEFSGARGVGNRTGHIPGARHLEWKRFTDEQGKFLPADALRALLNEQGIDLGTTIVAHCQTGGRSSVAVFALELAGVPNVKNYYPGWSEYANMLTAPVEQSSAQQ
jgi:thiosulfate/3-mercaptopyruvate sulfurtransferase